MMKKILLFSALLFSISWMTVANADIADGRYVMVNKFSGKVADVSGISHADGANIHQWSSTSGSNQQWDIAALGNGYFSIRAVHSGKSMDVWGWNSGNGADLRQYSYTGDINQQWSIVSNGDGHFRIVSRYSGKALEVANYSTSDGGNIHLWEFNGADNQLWAIQPVGGPGSSPAFDITNDMGAGWNLGNSLDAVGGETNWGNPVTQRYMIEAVANRGFKTLRIPVTWEGKFQWNGDRTIDPAWLSRVEQVVNYGLDNNMYVIINLHHEEWIMPTWAERDSTIYTLEKLWTQIATHFINYDQRLIFETMNEPRANHGTSLEWTGTQENYQVVNDFNAAALSAIRSTGSNNSNRLVLIPGYAAGPWPEMVDALVVPNDPMVAVSTHGYIPWDFAENTAGPSTFTQNDRDLIETVFDDLYSRFVSNGIPVVMGEWGTINKNNTSDRLAYAQFYASKASSVNIPTVVWDNNGGGSGAHSYRLYDRANNSWPFGNVADAIVNNTY